jgi:hypothetical protein
MTQLTKFKVFVLVGSAEYHLLYKEVCGKSLWYTVYNHITNQRQSFHINDIDNIFVRFCNEV